MKTSAKILNSKIKKRLSFNNNDRISVFINKDSNLSQIYPIIREVSKDNKGIIRITVFDADFLDIFRDLNVKIDHSWDYLNEDSCNYIDKFFFKNISRNWFKFEADLKNHYDEDRDKAFGRIAEFDFSINNLTLFKYIEVIRNIFIKYRPTKILIIDKSLCLVDIVKLFKGKNEFDFFRINLCSNSLSERLSGFKKLLKSFFIDTAILLLDFFVFQYILITKSFKNKIFIDYRLYKKFASTNLKNKLFICHFEKGLRVRIDTLRMGLFYFPFSHAVCLDRFFSSIKLFKIKGKLDSINLSEDVVSIFKYKDIMFWGAIRKYIDKALASDFPRITRNMNIFRKYIAGNKIKLIVMRNDAKELERTVIEAAKRFNIPTFVIQHGLYGDMNYSDTVLAHMTAVWGKASIDWFKQFGYQDDRFAITGNPLYDELCGMVSAERQNDIRKRVCQKFNLNFNKKIVTFLTQSDYLFGTSFTRGNRMCSMLRPILGTIKSTQNIQLIIKLHPYDTNRHIYSQMIKKFDLNNSVTAVQRFNVFDILAASDLAIMVDSSSGLEALILDKPLIVLKLYKSATIMPFAENGAAIGVEKEEEIGQAIKNGLYNEKIKEALKLKRKEFVFDYAYKIDGRSTERVIDLIERM